MDRVLAFLTVLLFPVFAWATPMTYQADLSGSNEFPPVASSGSGRVVVVIDTDADSLSIEATWSGLLAGSTVAHIHCCVDPSASFPIAGVAISTPGLPGFPAGATLGSYSMTLDLALAGTFSRGFILVNGGGSQAGAEAALAAALEAGFAYFNIHTEMFEGGEIRGFLVPEPGAALVVAAVLGLAQRRRVRRF